MAERLASEFFIPLFYVYVLCSLFFFSSAKECIFSHHFHLFTPSLNSRNDGAQPDYMEINPTQWLSSTLDACCKKFFGGFLYQQCTGAYPPDADDCTVLLYYPDWNGANEGCVADGE